MSGNNININQVYHFDSNGDGRVSQGDWLTTNNKNQKQYGKNIEGVIIEIPNKSGGKQFFVQGPNGKLYEVNVKVNIKTGTKNNGAITDTNGYVKTLSNEEKAAKWVEMMSNDPEIGQYVRDNKKALTKQLSQDSNFQKAIFKDNIKGIIKWYKEHGLIDPTQKNKISHYDSNNDRKVSTGDWLTTDQKDASGKTIEGVIDKISTKSGKTEYELRNTITGELYTVSSSEKIRVGTGDNKTAQSLDNAVKTKTEDPAAKWVDTLSKDNSGISGYEIKYIKKNKNALIKQLRQDENFKKAKTKEEVASIIKWYQDHGFGEQVTYISDTDHRIQSTLTAKNLKNYGIDKNSSFETIKKGLTQLQKDLAEGIANGTINEKNIKDTIKILKDFGLDDTSIKLIIENSFKTAMKMNNEYSNLINQSYADDPYNLHKTENDTAMADVQKKYNNIVALAGKFKIEKESLYGPPMDILNTFKEMGKSIAGNIYTDVSDNVAGKWDSIKLPINNEDLYLRKRDNSDGGGYEVYIKDAAGEYDIHEKFDNKEELSAWLSQKGVPPQQITDIINKSDSREETVFAKQANSKITELEKISANADKGQVFEQVKNLVVQNQSPGADKALSNLRENGVDTNNLNVKQFYCVDPSTGSDYTVSLIGGVDSKGKHYYVDLLTGRPYTGNSKQEVWDNFIKNTNMLPPDTLIAYKNESNQIIKTDIENTPGRYAKGAVASTAMLLGGVLCLIPTGVTQVIGTGLIIGGTTIQTYNIAERLINDEYVSNREIIDCAAGLLMLGGGSILKLAKEGSRLASVARSAVNISELYFTGTIGADTYKALMENDSEAAAMVIQNLAFMALARVIKKTGRQPSSKELADLGIPETINGKKTNVLEYVEHKIKQNKQKLLEKAEKFNPATKKAKGEYHDNDGVSFYGKENKITITDKNFMKEHGGNIKNQIAAKQKEHPGKELFYVVDNKGTVHFDVNAKMSEGKVIHSSDFKNNLKKDNIEIYKEGHTHTNGDISNGDMDGSLVFEAHTGRLVMTEKRVFGSIHNKFSKTRNRATTTRENEFMNTLNQKQSTMEGAVNKFKTLKSEVTLEKVSTNKITERMNEHIKNYNERIKGINEQQQKLRERLKGLDQEKDLTVRERKRKAIEDSINEMDHQKKLENQNRAKAMDEELSVITRKAYAGRKDIDGTLEGTNRNDAVSNGDNIHFQSLKYIEKRDAAILRIKDIHGSVEHLFGKGCLQKEHPRFDEAMTDYIQKLNYFTRTSGITKDVLRDALKISNGIHFAQNVEGRIANYQKEILENPFGGNSAAAIGR